MHTEQPRAKLVKPELLAPAGSLEKLKAAVFFGADAVYCGLPDFSLRARVNRFDLDQLQEGVTFCHQQGKRCYVTLNIFAREHHLKELPAYLDALADIGPDALIISDPGIFALAHQRLPRMPIHISTQANVTNSEAVKWWVHQGATRIILARELSLGEIFRIHKTVPESELEVFVHGAMCMAYSGRCILSQWMKGRNANLGDCVQPCRWKYQQGANLLENAGATAAREVFISDDTDRFTVEIQEEREGSYVMNSYDLCMISHLDELMAAGVSSVKIEGRSKSVFYVAMVTRAYRNVLDAEWELLQDPTSQQRKDRMTEIRTEQYQQLRSLTHRGYWTGFFRNDQPPHLTNASALRSTREFCGIGWRSTDQSMHPITVHNTLRVGQSMEVITPIMRKIVTVLRIQDDQGQDVQVAHGGTDPERLITFSEHVPGPFILRHE